MDEAAWLPLLQIFGPAGGMAALLFVMQARGYLVPKRIHDEARADRDAYRQASETAMLAALKASSTNETLAASVAIVVRNSEKQLEQGQRMLDVLEQLSSAPPERRAA